MVRRLFVLAMVGLVGCPLITPLSGCDGVGTEPKPTIDLSTPLKTPEVPTTQKVDVKPRTKQGQ
jgi:hypothetical protein